MHFTVGGEEYDLTPEQVERRMRGVEPEEIRKHVVEMLGTVYPPKQVFAVATGRSRTSFTTMEAQRVLTKLGFRCRTAGQRNDGTRAWLVDDGDAEVAQEGTPMSATLRLDAVEAQLATAMVAIQGLAARIASLEAR